MICFQAVLPSLFDLLISKPTLNLSFLEPYPHGTADWWEPTLVRELRELMCRRLKWPGVMKSNEDHSMPASDG